MSIFRKEQRAAHVPGRHDVHTFAVNDRVRDRGDGRTGTVISVTAFEIRWRPDRSDNPYAPSVFSSHPTSIEPC